MVFNQGFVGLENVNIFQWQIEFNFKGGKYSLKYSRRFYYLVQLEEEGKYFSIFGIQVEKGRDF